MLRNIAGIVMANKRPRKRNTPNEVETLVSSKRRCCICFGLHRDSNEKKGQIAHLDHDRSNDALDNLAWLCLEHHDDYDSRTSQSKSLQIGEVKRYREELYRFVLSNAFQGEKDACVKLPAKGKVRSLTARRLNVILFDPPHICKCCGHSFLITPDLQDGKSCVVPEAKCPKCGNRDRVMRFYDG